MNKQKHSILIGLAVAFLLVIGYQTATLISLSLKIADAPLATGTAQAKVFSTNVELPDMAGGC